MITRTQIGLSIAAVILMGLGVHDFWSGDDLQGSNFKAIIRALGVLLGAYILWDVWQASRDMAARRGLGPPPQA